MQTKLTLRLDERLIRRAKVDRAPHAAPATELFDLVARKELDGLLGATILSTIFYLAAKAAGPAQARRHVSTLLSAFEVAAVTRSVLADALGSGFKDYEDAVLHEGAPGGSHGHRDPRPCRIRSGESQGVRPR